MASDKQLIEALGGSASVAKKLGYSVQRVDNWKRRGIPSSVQLQYRTLFEKARRLLRSSSLSSSSG